jgi:hypothetical protein
MFMSVPSVRYITYQFTASVQKERKQTLQYISVGGASYDEERRPTMTDWWTEFAMKVNSIYAAQTVQRTDRNAQGIEGSLTHKEYVANEVWGRRQAALLGCCQCCGISIAIIIRRQGNMLCEEVTWLVSYIRGIAMVTLANWLPA